MPQFSSEALAPAFVGSENGYFNKNKSKQQANKDEEAIVLQSHITSGFSSELRQLRPGVVRADSSYSGSGRSETSASVYFDSIETLDQLNKQFSEAARGLGGPATTKNETATTGTGRRRNLFSIFARAKRDLPPLPSPRRQPAQESFFSRNKASPSTTENTTSTATNKTTADIRMTENISNNTATNNNQGGTSVSAKRFRDTHKSDSDRPESSAMGQTGAATHDHQSKAVSSKTGTEANADRDNNKKYSDHTGALRRKLESDDNDNDAESEVTFEPVGQAQQSADQRQEEVEEVSERDQDNKSSKRRGSPKKRNVSFDVDAQPKDDGNDQNLNDEGRDKNDKLKLQHEDSDHHGGDDDDDNDDDDSASSKSSTSRFRAMVRQQSLSTVALAKEEEKQRAERYENFRELLGKPSNRYMTQDSIRKPKGILRRIRVAVGHFVDRAEVQTSIIILIIINAVIMGVATFDFVDEDEEVSNAFEIVDRIFLIIFTLELVLQFIYRSLSLFQDGWLVFDFVIVVISWSLESLQIIRAFRIFRAFRLITRIGPLRELVMAIGQVMPRIYAIALLLLLIFYIFAVLFTELFSDLELEESYFTSLDRSLFTCMQLMTLEWAGIAREVMEQKSWAWAPFVAFISMTGFIVFNLIVAVVCDAVAVVDKEIRLEKGESEDTTKILSITKERIWDLTEQVEMIKARHEEIIDLMAVMRQETHRQKKQMRENSSHNSNHHGGVSGSLGGLSGSLSGSLHGLGFRSERTGSGSKKHAHHHNDEETFERTNI